MKKRVLAVLLTMMMVFTIIPTVAATTHAASSPLVQRDIILMLDISDSMVGTPLTVMKQAAIRFCDDLIKSADDNRIGLVIWDFDCTSYDFSNDIESIKGRISAITLGAGTKTDKALRAAKNLMHNNGRESATKNIVLMTDGLPTYKDYSGSGPYTYSDYPGSNNLGDYYYACANSAYSEAQSIMTSYNLYTLGFFHSLTGNDLIFGRRFLNDIQNAGYYEVIDPDDLEFVFGDIAGNIVGSGKFKYPGEGRDYSAAYFYEDAYFLKDSSIYNPQLATMSLCLELTSWSSEDTSIWPDKTKNARELLTGELLIGPIEYIDGAGGLGFKEFDQNEVWVSSPTRDSIGLIAANKTIVDSNDADKEYTLIALAVRGGGYGSEWSSNFTVGSSGTHAGFTLARDDALNFLKEYISDYSITGDIKLWVVGYSRAGATANMIGGALDDGYSLPGVSLAHKDLYVYTFEAPQGALRSAVTGSGHGDYTNIHNIINLNDPVPLVAPYPWGFSRYNNDIWLPSAFTSSSFSSQRSAMLTQYNRLEGARAAGYKIQESSTQQNLRVDRSKWLPGGDPLWWWEDSEVSQRDVLIDSVYFLANDVLESRANYYSNLQDGVREIFGVLNDGSDKMDLFIEEFASRLDGGTIVGFLALGTLVNPLKSFEDWVNEVSKRVQAFVRENVQDIAADLRIAVTSLFIDSLAKVMGDLIVSVAMDVWDNNTDSVNLIIKLVDLIMSGSIPQAHYPEICLAWMMSRDTNYYGSTEAGKIPDTHRIIRINCPVDVSVYDGNELLVASIVNDIKQDVDSSVICFINNKGEKIVYLPADEDYQIKLQATDDGEVTYSVGEYSSVDNVVLRLVNYYSVPITNEDYLLGVVPAFSAEEIESGTPNGSSVEYKLLDSSGNEVTGKEELSEAEVSENYFKVSVVADNDSGYVDGSGTFVKGSFARVEAQPLSGSSFLGWYVDDNLVSNDSVYRFGVIEDVTLIAKFTHVEKHELKLVSGTGGKITSVEGFYSAGSEIAVVAEADDGYTFKEWTATQGVFDSITESYAWFTMPDVDAVLTANFELLTSDYFTISATARTGGVVSGGGTYPSGATVTLTATSNNSYYFEGWYENGTRIASAGASYSFTAAADRTLEARFTYTYTGGSGYIPPSTTPSTTTVSDPETLLSWLSPFEDVNEGDWFYDDVGYVHRNDLMLGTSANKFSPNIPLTRGMAVTVLYRIESEPGVIDLPNPFSDVVDGNYYTNAVKWAADKGIVLGFPSGKFGPEDMITRQDLAIILNRYAGYKDMKLPNTRIYQKFNDDADIANYARDAVETFFRAVVINGKPNNKFDPKGQATRAEYAAIIHRMLEVADSEE